MLLFWLIVPTSKKVLNLIHKILFWLQYLSKSERKVEIQDYFLESNYNLCFSHSTFY